MRRSRSISGLLSVAAFMTSFLEIAVAAHPVAADASPANDPIPQVAGSKIFENGTGFMWGTSGSSFVMVRTLDGGKSWSTDSLDGVSIDLGALATAAGGRITSVYVHFADPERGWVAWSTDDSVFHIASTADSGASWREALSLQTDAVFSRDVFPGPGRACIVAEMPEGMMHATMVTMTTDDNGVTWTPSVFSHGDGVSDVTFRSATDGFLSVDYPSGVRILFYRTTDGGKSWDGVDIPLPPDVPEAGGTFPGTPVFSDPQRLTGLLTVGLSMPEGMVHVTYRTTDGGKTWTYSK
jgi:photosystem II stability/assembly factor-like uncharacterized protein